MAERIKPPPPGQSYSHNALASPTGYAANNGVALLQEPLRLQMCGP